MLLYVTTWPGEDAGAARHDPRSLALFAALRRHSAFALRATRSGGAPVDEHFSLLGARSALDALECPHP